MAAVSLHMTSSLWLGAKPVTLLPPARALPLVVRRQLTPILQAVLVLEMYAKDR